MRTLLSFISAFLITVSTANALTYTVRKGDSLGKIAKRFHTTVTSLKKINHLKSNVIYPGQKLKIPSSSEKNKQRYIIYKVKRGDSLKKLAKRFGTTVSEIKRINHLKKNVIYVGQKLKIPTKTPHPTYKSQKISSSKNEVKYSPNGLMKVPVYKYYRVRRGDSILKIAKKFRVSPRMIIRLNHLRKPYIIRPGQKLKILVGYRDVIKLNRPIEFHFPLDGRVDPTVREKGYPGIFIIGKVGQKVRAAETGIVKFAGKEDHFLKAYGKTVIIQHPEGYRTVYSNLDQIFVKPKQVVKRGEVIGTAGTSGDWGKPGVYFEISKVYKNKVYPINPLEVLK
ncbi:Murein DD-endopeptidase MepM and murein hydrolase activator NlpD, contain LysM domain [Desulfurobacterium pacificum]|uniref:Murein DD-endopeptidase MepM and murein hydrolase activator NlpD, contain LysM domain n=1 Tax=Desulfurobacterium pacificum TaxID=240166 RepID=A0ABY1NMC7_9BACT|nr:LysM peptidoglycan-binding domain-containing protein [Desulfurobacterium pacificum]SMP13324.1 Murein DD-endopeptidase MepM and murein hydrolase activator NlpD, contain LysM domain [Desulfurobacterium pacificum]